jgi:hypothetical protein
LAAWEDGQRYEEIRDTLREPWNRQMREEGARQGEHGEER